MRRFFGLVLSFLLTTSLFAGQVFYVVEGGAGNKDGTSWANAFADVQTAIDKAYEVATADNPSEVWIAKGTYKHGSQMTMKNNVAIYGGFVGTETSKDQRIAGNNTILAGEGKYRVFYNNYTEANKLTNSAKLDNVTIRNGYANSNSENYGYGAGMYNYYASPEITNCKFEENMVSSGNGGGVYNYCSFAKFISCIFFGNDTLEGNGGGVCNYSSNTVFTDCVFEYNSCGGEYTKYGGGMYNISSEPRLINCLFKGNLLDGGSCYGGGMGNSSSNPILVNCTFIKNIVKGYYTGSSCGGGMCNENNSSPVLLNCVFFDNDANNGRSGNGGGMYNKYSSPVLTNCILWGNTALSSGNEIFNYNSSKPTIDTCIIEGGYSSSYGTYTNIITADPKLMPLGNYGGSVQTIAVGEGSSAIGSGKVVDGVTTDARGVVRSTTAPTIGAYEYVKVDITASEENLEDNAMFPEESVSFKVVANETGVNYQWQYSADNSKWIDIDGVTSSEFTIDSISSENFGYYRCVMSGKMYNTKYSSVAHIESKPAPSITTQPEEIGIFANNDGSLSVVATGEELTYQWYFNGEAIEGATESTLSFENIQTGKAGSYYCVITNPAGRVQTNTVVVSVKPAPSIETQPAGFEVFANVDKSLSVSATGEELAYQWYFNGKVIDGATSAILSFEKIQTNQAGSYYCVITNPAGSVQTNTVDVLVKPSPTIDNNPTGFEVWSNVDRSLSVSATGEELSYQWYHNGKAIEGATDSTLSFENIQADKAGSYYCVITNPTGSVQSSIAEIIVRESASIVEHPQDIVSYTSIPTTLKVSARGYSVSYQWQRLVNDEWVDIANATSSTFEIESAMLSDTGKYRCVVSNGGATITSNTATLTVRETASIVEQPQSVELFSGYSTTLKVSTKGYSVSYQWQKLVNDEWVDIANATSSTYEISSTKLSDNGEYRCIVSNGGATIVSDSAKLSVLMTSKIKIIQQPVAIPTAVDDDTELSVSASGGGIYYQWQVKNGKVWEDEIGETSSTLELKNLKAEDNNKEYRCILKNDISTATSKTAKLVVISTPLPVIDTKKHVPEVAIITGKKNKATFAIKSTKPKGETGTYKYQWYKNGEPIAKATKATYTTDVLTDSDFELNPKDNIYYTKDTYYCVISVDVKKTIVNQAQTENLKVMKLEPAKILKNPEDVVVSSGEDAIFTAEATKTSGVKAVYQWQVCAFGSDPNNPKNWKNAGKGATLTLKKATVKLSGNLYRCQVYNDLNKKTPHTSTHAKLEVKGTPIIKTQPKAITTYEGLDLELMAFVSGYDLTYIWQISADGKTNWETLLEDDFLLLLEDVESTFFYQFVAYNDENEVVSSKSAKVTVKAKVEVQYLEVLQNKLPVDVDNDSAKVVSIADVVLSVTATGDSPKYEWQVSDDGKSWTAIKGATKKTYTIKKTNLIIENDRMFRCRVYNGTGKIGTDSYIGTEDFSNAVMIIVK